MSEAPWPYVIEFDRLPERLGGPLHHPDIAAAGLAVRVDPGGEPRRSVAIKVDGNARSLSCCEFDLLNGDERISSYSFAVNYRGGSKFLTMRTASELRPDARIIIKCGRQDAGDGDQTK